MNLKKKQQNFFNEARISQNHFVSKPVYLGNFHIKIQIWLLEKWIRANVQKKSDQISIMKPVYLEKNRLISSTFKKQNVNFYKKRTKFLQLETSLF